MRPYCLICMCLFVPSLIKAQLKHLDSTLDELVQLEWQIFSEANEESRMSLLMEKADVFMKVEDYDGALENLDRINTNILSVQSRDSILLERAYLYYLKDEFQQSLSQVLQIEMQGRREDWKNLQLIKVMNYVALGEFENANETYQLVWPDRLESKVFERRLKKEQKAFSLSFILPGAGQLYAGYPFKAITSLGLQAFFFTYGIKGLQREYFFTQTLPSIAIFQGFYFGGADYSKDLVRKKNDLIKKKLTNEIVASMGIKKPDPN